MKPFVFTVALFCSLSIYAQTSGEKPVRKEIGNVSILSGLHQPILLKGGNIALNYVTKKNIVLEASFGFGLKYTSLLSTEDKEKFTTVESPFSYGFGVGYFWKGLNLLVEPKGTIFKMTDHQGKEETYTTFSVGLGAYYNIYLWKGLFLQPTVKFWPKVGSTLSSDGVEMQNVSGQKYIHEARTPGNNGLIYGASLGWTF
ncbi:hypothetical protein [Lacibacter sp. H407]|uniref:hypothetical protein n=1 Tax=Lacibacter sp. H407 TaxID=3133423 RepID=UPI0030BA71CE